MQTSQAVRYVAPEPGLKPAERQVVACVDRSRHAEKIVPHALALANALGSSLTLLRVLEARRGNDSRPDPIEWDIRRHEAREGLRRLAKFCGDEIVEAELAEGGTAEEICRRSDNRAARLMVLGTRGEGGVAGRGLGGTAHSVLERAAGPVLLVPLAAPQIDEVSYRRILVPVDGSSWAESVMPLALRLATASGAELVIAHIVPGPELTETGPLEAEDIALRERVIERNERIARAYVDRLRGHAAEKGLKVRTLVRRSDDVRTGLAHLIASEDIDLVVLSARGHGRSRPFDLPYGDVAAYLTTHSSAPILMTRPGGASIGKSSPPLSRVGRLPFRASR